MRVFPLEARQEKRIILQLHATAAGAVRADARTASRPGTRSRVVDQWSFQAVVKDGAELSVVVAVAPDDEARGTRAETLSPTDEAKNAKVDRDVVLELHRPPGARRTPESVRWSAGELDGQKYLMLRYRPDLPTAPRRERRDWVFLFESSGARDPLVARAQVEVIRSLLTNAEHDDTFAVLSVGTRVRKMDRRAAGGDPGERREGDGVAGAPAPDRRPEPRSGALRTRRRSSRPGRTRTSSTSAAASRRSANSGRTSW